MDLSFDIVMQDDDFILYVNEKPMLSAYGNSIAHSNARLLRFAITNKIFPTFSNLSPLKLLTRLVDVQANSDTFFEFELHEVLLVDPLLETSPISSLMMNDFMQDNTFLLDYIFLNSSSLASSFNNFLLKKEENQSKHDFLIQSINELSVEQQLVLNALYTENGEGLAIHMLLLMGLISVSEYASGLLIMKMKNNNPEVIDKIKNEGVKAIAWIQQQIITNTLTGLDFLTMCENKNKISVIEEIINRGEDNQTEFKSTLRWDIRQEKKNPAIEHAVLKTICAFLNSEGGDLLIGVRDDGSIEGIEPDQFDNDDRFLLHLWTLIKTSMGDEVVEWVKTKLQKFGDKTVCRVNCRKAKKPVFLNQKGFDEAFFVRVGPSSSNLEIRSALTYIEQHF